MSELVSIDQKGRLVLPKRIRTRAGIRSGTSLVAEVKGDGVVELRDSGALLNEVQRVAARKLTGWKEEEHREDRMLSASAR